MSRLLLAAAPMASKLHVAATRLVHSIGSNRLHRDYVLLQLAQQPLKRYATAFAQLCRRARVPTLRYSVESIRERLVVQS